jgi:serine/threonine protein phosphatase PrpC
MGILTGSGATHPGKVRPHNEDATLVEPTLGVFAVADGMGGHEAGEVAAALALEAVLGFLVRSQQNTDHTWPFGVISSLDPNGNRLRTAVKLANRRVFRESERRDDYTGMGTTIAALLVDDGSAAVCGVGDSRVYQIRGGAIQRLTRDHTWVETLMAQVPGLDPASLERHPMRHVLTSVLGVQDDVDVTVTACDLQRGDRFALCTDGVHGALADDRISAIVRAAATAEAGARQLVAEALERDGQDNLTAVVVEVV